MYLLRQTYYLCKTRDALAHFNDLCHLSELQGLSLGSAYRNAHAARDFALAISTAVLQQWLPHARSSPSLGLMMDESTTVSSDGTLILYLRFVMHGQATTKFWKLLRVADGSAPTIVKVLLSYPLFSLALTLTTALPPRVSFRWPSLLGAVDRGRV